MERSAGDKLRVGIVTDTFPKLSETFILDQARALAELGFNVSVVSDRLSANAVTGAVGHARLTVLRRWNALSRALGLLDRLPARASDKTTALLDLLFSRNLTRFDVLIAHFGMNGARVARAGRRWRVFPPLVTIFHGFDVGMVERDGTIGQYRGLFGFPGLLLTVNRTFRDMLVAAGAPPDRTRVHHMGIPAKAFPYRTRIWDGRTLGFLTVGRLTEKKGIAYALRAVATLDVSDIGRDWSYTIVGEGELRRELEDLAASLDLGARVRFLGAQPHDVVRRLLYENHVLLLPSTRAATGDMEGIPVVLMEAMAAGLIAMSTRHSGIPELVSDGVSGLLVDERDTDSLGKRLRWIFDHPEGLAGIAATARSVVEADFNGAVQTEELAGWLVELAGNSRPGKARG